MVDIGLTSPERGVLCKGSTKRYRQPMGSEMGGGRQRAYDHIGSYK